MSEYMMKNMLKFSRIWININQTMFQLHRCYNLTDIFNSNCLILNFKKMKKITLYCFHLSYKIYFVAYFFFLGISSQLLLYTNTFKVIYFYKIVLVTTVTVVLFWTTWRWGNIILLKTII